MRRGTQDLTLGERLSRFPRLGLTRLPTPLEPLPRLSAVAIGALETRLRDEAACHVVQ